MPISMRKIVLEDIFHVLTSYNYWWQLGEVSKDKLPKTKRTAFYALNSEMKSNRVVTLYGPRLVGKTTILYQTIQSLIESGIAPERIVFIPLSHPIFRFFSPREILRIYHDNVYAGNDSFHFFDEAQCIPNWSDWQDAICTKSIDKAAKIVVAQSLSPRSNFEDYDYPCTGVSVPPLSFYEYCQIFCADELPALTVKIRPNLLPGLSRQEQTSVLFRMAPLRKHFARYIQVGGFPGIQTSEQANSQLQGMVNRIIRSDISYAYSLRSIDDLERVFLTLCYQDPLPQSIDQITKSLGGISRKTIEKYIYLLEKSGLISISGPVSVDGQPLQKTQPKIYVSDFAIQNAVRMQSRLRTDRESLNYSIEMSVFRQLKSIYSHGDTIIGYSKSPTSRNKLIDIVVKNKNRTFIDIRFLDEFTVSASDPIVQFANECKSAYILTKREHDFGPIPNAPSHIYRLPAHAYLYLLGHYEKQMILGKVPKVDSETVL